MREFTFVSIEAFLACVVVFTWYFAVQIYTHVTFSAVTLKEKLACLHFLGRNKVVTELASLTLSI